MNKRFLLVLLSFVLLFQACKKDKDPIVSNDPPANQDSTEQIIEIKTTFGSMYVWLYKETPLHRENFLKLASEGFYDGTTFHRIIPKFMIQGGDPNSKDNNPANDGQGGPGYEIAPEFRDNLKNIRGAVATARTNNPEKKSSGSQFFINVVPNSFLDQEYTVFGYVMKGMEAADEIVTQTKDRNDRPITDIKMEVKILKKTKTEILSEYGYEVK